MTNENEQMHHMHSEHEHDDHQNHHHHEGHEDHQDHGGHGDHHHHGDFKEIFLNSLWVGIPILLLSPFMGLTETGFIHFPYSDIVSAVLATILLFYGGKPFFEGGWHEIKAGAPSMMALVSLGLGDDRVHTIDIRNAKS